MSGSTSRVNMKTKITIHTVGQQGMEASWFISHHKHR